MKKLLYLVLFSLILVSCSNDESDVEPDPYILENIIGSWAYDTVTINSETFLYQHTDGCVKDLFQFYNEDGKEIAFGTGNFTKSKIHNNGTPVFFDSRVLHAVPTPLDLEEERVVFSVNIHSHPTEFFRKAIDGTWLNKNTENIGVSNE